MYSKVRDYITVGQDKYCNYITVYSLKLNILCK